MLTEDYVSFETAKLLKEKGFKGEGGHFYENKKIVSFADYWDRITPYERYCAIECPTLQMAMKWLREVHKIEIRVVYDNDRLSWYGACNPMNEPSQILLGSGRKSKSYEEACESAIGYCLKNLI